MLAQTDRKPRHDGSDLVLAGHPRSGRSERGLVVVGCVVGVALGAVACVSRGPRVPGQLDGRGGGLEVDAMSPAVLVAPGGGCCWSGARWWGAVVFEAELELAVWAVGDQGAGPAGALRCRAGRSSGGRPGCGRPGCGRRGCGRHRRGRDRRGRPGCGRPGCGRPGCGRHRRGRHGCGRRGGGWLRCGRHGCGQDGGCQGVDGVGGAGSAGGVGPGGGAVRGEGDAPAGALFDPVVASAQGEQVGVVGGAGGPGSDVVEVAEHGGDGAAGEPAAPVAGPDPSGHPHPGPVRVPFRWSSGTGSVRLICPPTLAGSVAGATEAT